jgi:transposase
MQVPFAAREREQINAFKGTYHHRAGIEGTHSQAVRAMGLRCLRYISLHKTHLGHLAVAAALHLVR